MCVCVYVAVHVWLCDCVVCFAVCVRVCACVFAYRFEYNYVWLCMLIYIALKLQVNLFDWFPHHNEQYICLSCKSQAERADSGVRGPEFKTGCIADSTELIIYLLDALCQSGCVEISGEKPICSVHSTFGGAFRETWQCMTRQCRHPPRTTERAYGIMQILHVTGNSTNI